MSGEDHYRFGRKHEYLRALSAVIAKGISEEERALLSAHLRSPDQTASAQRLAEMLGYPTHGLVGSIYASLSQRVAEQLGVLQIPREGFWLVVLAELADPAPATGDTQFVLRPPVVHALTKLGFSTDAAIAEPVVTVARR